jgi:DNA-directed RNA polymerase subunit M/transcription elongation factor TFIIS
MADSVDAQPTLTATDIDETTLTQDEAVGDLTDVLSSAAQDTTDMPFQCKRCGYRTQYRSGMVRHLTNTRPCPPRLQNILVEDLRREFDETDPSRIDVSRTCQKCGKKFASRQSRYQHIAQKRCKVLANQERIAAMSEVTNAVMALVDFDATREQPIVIQPVDMPIFEPRSTPSQNVNEEAAHEEEVVVDEQDGTMFAHDDNDVAATVVSVDDQDVLTSADDVDEQENLHDGSTDNVTKVANTDDAIWLGGKKIRKTRDNPPRVSVYDLIAAVACQADSARKVYHRLVAAHPGIQAICHDYLFPGRGQKVTPVTDARGFVKIVNMLPGRRAACFRDATADIVVRFLGGDMTLVDELQRNAAQAQFMPATSAESLFAADVKDKSKDYSKYNPNRSTIYIKSGSLRRMNGPGVYFIIYGVKVVYDSDGLPMNVLVVGFGCSHNIAERFKSHEQTAGQNTRLLNIIPTQNYCDLEKTMKTIMKNSGRLVKGCIVGKPSQMGELFWVDSVEDYHNLLKDFEEEAQDIDARTGSSNIDQEIKWMTVRARMLEAETMKMKVENERLFYIPPPQQCVQRDRMDD